MMHRTKVNMNLRTITLALALLVPVSTQAATIIVDGDTIDIDGVRIRIVQINTPETFGPRCENKLVLGLKANKRFRELLGIFDRRHDVITSTLVPGVWVIGESHMRFLISIRSRPAVGFLIIRLRIWGSGVRISSGAPAKSNT
jgi:hypothetical protein